MAHQQSLIRFILGWLKAPQSGWMSSIATDRVVCATYFTGRFALSAKRRYISYTEGEFEVFAPRVDTLIANVLVIFGRLAAKMGMNIQPSPDLTLPNLTRMWANAQPDGRPAEHRWRPLFNAAKFS